MIRIRKPAAPAILRGRGKVARKAHCDDFNRGLTEFEFDRTIYADRSVKAALLVAQNGKCAFCESKITHIQRGDIEHFRPKAGFRQHEGGPLERPGYYWLAYEWSNLFLSCQLCNQQHKKNLFPLDDPARRASSHRHRLADESPLLIDCGREDPEASIGFREELAVSIGDDPRGGSTIAALGLNREPLAGARRDYLKLVRTAIESLTLLESEIQRIGRSSDPGAALLRSRLKDCQDLLHACHRKDSPYSSMVRCMMGGGQTSKRRRKSS